MEAGHDEQQRKLVLCSIVLLRLLEFGPFPSLAALYQQDHNPNECNEQ
jgi:hypothetical protein